MDTLEDGLGSIRAEINHNSQVIAGTRTMNPYGDVMTDYNYGTMDSGYGFTGEQIDPNELVYLRARYYDPNVGNFASLDPFEGMNNRPMSMNGYSWVEGNVANWSDPTGNIPEFEGIISDPPIYTYSCNCGWIDWKHADPNIVARKVISYVKDALDYFEINPTADVVAIRGENIQHEINVPIIGKMTTYDNLILITSSINISNWVQVAMAIFRDVEFAHESSFWSGLSRFNNRPSFGSEEDLTSNLIAFYRALDQHNWDFDNAFATLSNICGYPNSKEQSRQWSLDVFNEYGNYSEVWIWESPRLHNPPQVCLYCGE